MCRVQGVQGMQDAGNRMCTMFMVCVGGVMCKLQLCAGCARMMIIKNVLNAHIICYYKCRDLQGRPLEVCTLPSYIF